MSIYLHTVYGYFHATMVEFCSYNRNQMAPKPEMLPSGSCLALPNSILLCAYVTLFQDFPFRTITHTASMNTLVCALGGLIWNGITVSEGVLVFSFTRYCQSGFPNWFYQFTHPRAEYKCQWPCPFLASPTFSIVSVQVGV